MPSDNGPLNDRSEPFGAAHGDIANALVLDVRRKPAFDASTVQLLGAQWRDPAAVESWVASLPNDRTVVVYCVYGHEVSRNVVMRLRAAGLNARYLRGGIDGWQKAGLPVETKPGQG